MLKSHKPWAMMLGTGIMFSTFSSCTKKTITIVGTAKESHAQTEKSPRIAATPAPSKRTEEMKSLMLALGVKANKNTLANLSDEDIQKVIDVLTAAKNSEGGSRTLLLAQLQAAVSGNLGEATAKLAKVVSLSKSLKGGAGGASGTASETPDSDAPSSGGSGSSTPPACGSLASGASESRVRFGAAVVESGSTCTSETQTRSCASGTLSPWSGSYSFESCLVRAPAPASSHAAGEVPEGTLLTLSSTLGGDAQIYYTVDGSTPSDASTLYTGPLSFGASDFT